MTSAMTSTKLERGDWVVVCDGRKAIILENQGDALFPNLRVQETYEHADQATHVTGRAAPGRSFQSVGHHRSAVAETDRHDESERSFLHSLAERLARALLDGKTGSMTMVAPPRALGMIRDAYSPAVRRAITREIAKDVVKLPVHEIEHMLTRPA